MARVNKFASVNLNDLFGKKEPAVKTAVNSSGSAVRPKGASHGGMLVLTRPVKQQVKIGAGSCGNLKKENSESSTPTATNTPGWSKNSQLELENGDTIKDNCELLHSVNKPDAYVPPSLRGSHPISTSSGSGKLEAVTVEKAVVLRGEEFPTLKASIGPANTNGQQQRTKDMQHHHKDNQLDAKEQLEKLQQLSLQAHSKTNSDDSTEPEMNRFQPQRPQFFRPPQLREDQQVVLGKPEKMTERLDGSQFRNSYLKVDYNASDWTDDERANGIRPGSANGNRRPGSGGYRDQIYQTDEKSVVYHPPSREGRYEMGAMPQSGSGGSRFEREALPRPGSGGSRYEKEALLQPGSVGGRYEQEALPRPRSRGSRYEREMFPHPSMGGGRYEGETFFRPNSGGGRYEGETFFRPNSGGGRYERQVLPFPGSDRGIHENELISCSGYDSQMHESEVISFPGSNGHSQPASGGDKYLRPISRGGYDREAISRPGVGGAYYPQHPQQGSGVNDYVWPSSGGSGNGREVVLRPGSGGNENSHPGSGGADYRSRPGLVGDGQVESGELYRDSSFNGKKFFERQMTHPSGSNAEGRYRGQSYHNTYESNREKGAFRDNWFRPSGMSRELPNRDDYHARGQSIVDGDGRDCSHESARNRDNVRRGGSEGCFIGQLREREGSFGGSVGALRDSSAGRYNVPNMAQSEPWRTMPGGHDIDHSRPRSGGY